MTNVTEFTLHWSPWILSRTLGITLSLPIWYLSPRDTRVGACWPWRVRATSGEVWSVLEYELNELLKTGNWPASHQNLKTRSKKHENNSSYILPGISFSREIRSFCKTQRPWLRHRITDTPSGICSLKRTSLFLLVAGRVSCSSSSQHRKGA